jgi:CheY-like chemotaxis protein
LATGAGARAEQPVSDPRVLIIDDSAINVDLVTFVLQSASFTVEAARDAADGIARIRSFHPDLILMDIQMPDMDGLELTRLLKADPATRDIVIIALTAYAMKSDEARARVAGCNGYLAKPINVATFADQLRAFMLHATEGNTR